MHNHNAPRILIACCLILACCGSTIAAASFPFNGSFELISTGKPVGWQSNGAWFVRPDAAVDGRNGVTVFGDYGKQDAQLVTTGYLLANNEPLTLSFSYTSPTGNVSYGLIFCDALGNPITTSEWESLPVTESWSRYTRDIALPACVEVPAKPQPEETAAPAAAAAEAEAQPRVPEMQQVVYAGVRLVFRLDEDGAQVKLDNVKLSHDHSILLAPKPPKIKAELRPNLLPNCTFATDADGHPRNWVPLTDSGHAGELAVVESLGLANTLVLNTGATMGAAWLADPLLLDGALPYRLETDISAADLLDARARVLINLIDPQDDKSVWLQYEQEVAIGHDGGIVLALPRLWTAPGAVRAQVAIEVSPEGCGQTIVRNIALSPEPLSVAVRSVAVAGGFKRPSDVSLFISAVNNTYSVLKPKAVLQVCDADGKSIASETRPIVIGSRSAAYFPFKPKLACSGDYQLTVKIFNGGQELGAAVYDFRVGEIETAALVGNGG